MTLKSINAVILCFLIFFTGWYTNPTWPVPAPYPPYPSEWVHYPMWIGKYHSTLGENYAYPASLSNDHDPRWGFWFW